jgi:hypothetical protein
MKNMQTTEIIVKPLNAKYYRDETYQAQQAQPTQSQSFLERVTLMLEEAMTIFLISIIDVTSHHIDQR